MSWFSRLFRGKPKVPDMTHPYFGELTSECDGDALDQWLGEIEIPQFSQKATLYIIGSYEGPSAAQVEFARDLVGHFDRIVALIEQPLRDCLKKHTGQPVERGFWEEFRLGGVTIPKDGDRRNEWGLDFGSQSDGNHAYCVEFRNGEMARVFAE